MTDKKGKLQRIVIFLDVVGFFLLTLGAVMIRFTKDELFSVLGGFVLAGGVAVLSATRMVK